jgi:putative ABC transport system substrate-binding protein
MPVIGFLGSASAGPYARMMAAFRQGLNEIGYVEDRNVAIEYRWAEGQNDRLPALAADLVRRQVTVITTTGTPETLAAKAATTTIPIVFQIGIEPVQVGLVASLSRPGGNLTGVTNLNVEVGPKRLELLQEVVPTATLMAYSSTRPVRTLPSRLRKTRLRRPGPSECSSMCCMRARNAISMTPSQP